MPRKYVRKTNRVDIDEEAMRRAIKDCLKKTGSTRNTAALYGVNRNTLQTRLSNIVKRKEQTNYMDSDSGTEMDPPEKREFHSKYSVKQVFSKIEEEEFSEYIKRCSDLHYGLSYRQIRTLAFEYAKIIPDCKYPASWVHNKMAGVDWIKGFMMRHNELSLRKPESTSMMRATAFNKDRVEEFFNNYSSLLEKYKFKPDRIFNLDETGITTVMKCVKIVSKKGKKQVGQVASGERGELVTFVGIINAIGGTVPPIYVFPRIRHPEEYLTDGLASSLVLGNKSGWMTKELFPTVIRHIIQHTNCSLDNRILLLIDNHESHTSVETIKLCREAGITLLSFPPHTTHRLQPLDVGVYGPFKSALAVAYDDWLLCHPGQVVNMRNIGKLSKLAYFRAFSISNILNAFKKPGIWPLNRLVFSDQDFVASSVTNTEIIASNGRITEETDDQLPTLCENNLTAERAKPNEGRISLKSLRPFPKIKEIKKVTKRKRESKSKIYTSTPELIAKESLEMERNRKLSIQLNKKAVKGSNQKKTKRNLFSQEPDASSSESDVSVHLIDSDADESLDDFPLLNDTEYTINVEDFVLVKFASKTTHCYYVGKVVSKHLNDSQIKILRRRNTSTAFVFPNVDDIATIDREEIVAVLPKPTTAKPTARTASIYCFKYNFRGWDVR